MKIFEIITEAPRVDPDIIQKIKDLWDSGMHSPNEIAKVLSITPQTVSKILFKHYHDRTGKEKKEKRSDDFIQKVKDLWDNGLHSYIDIANKLETTPKNISNILASLYKDRSNKREKNYSPELIQKVKDLWDSGITSPKQIAAELKIPERQAVWILFKHYSDRPNKQENYSPELIQQVKKLWDSGMRSPKEIAKELSLNTKKVAKILYMFYPDRPGKLRQGSIPRELMPSIIAMYKNGQSSSTIVKLLNIDATDSGIDSALKVLPNWDEIRAEHLANKPTRKQNVATTDIHRPGTIGNERSKGYGSRHTAGVNWPKYG